MTTFHARCFGPGFDPHGERVAVALDDDALLICLGETRELRVAAAAIKVRGGGFHHDQLMLEWQVGDARYGLSLIEAEARRSLLAHAPAALAVQLQQWQRRQRQTGRRYRLGWGLLTVLLLSPLLLAIVFWWQSERIIGWAVDHVSLEAEQQLGEMAFAQATAGMTMIESGPALAFVRQVGGRLTQGSQYTFQWHLVQNPAVNAFAVPGGHVVVFTGLLKSAQTPEEVAGVLAHEAQHVMQRHSLRGMVQAAGWQAVVGLALGDIGGGVASRLATELGTLQFSRQQETDADLKGLELLRAAGIPADGMLTFFERMSKQDGRQLELLSTHPASATRLATLRAALARQGGGSVRPLNVDWAGIQAGLR